MYCGKETESVLWTFGKRVVQKLAEAVCLRNEVVLIFDKFFTSTYLLNSIEYPAVRTYNKNKRNVAKPNAKFIRKGEGEAAVCKEGLCVSTGKTPKTFYSCLIVINQRKPLPQENKKMVQGKKLHVQFPSSFTTSMWEGSIMLTR